MFNETYSRDISQKVSNALAAKELRGDYIGVWAPYGYKKSAANHHRLEINEETAPIVRRIFALRMEGYGYEKIARILNQEGIPSPSVYLYQNGLTKNEKYKDPLWSPWNTKTILRNEVYLGHLIQGKRTNVGYKQIRSGNSARLEELRIVRNVHEPIIGEELFRAVQRLSEKRTAAYKATLGTNGSEKSDNLFRGLVFCAHCGKALSRRQLRSGNRTFYYNYLCLTALKMPTACTRKNLHECDLLRVVTNSIRRYMEAVAELENRVQLMWTQKSGDIRKKLEQRAAAAERELAHSQTLYEGLYRSFVDGLITRQEYADMKERYQTQQREQEAVLEQLHAELRELARLSPDNPLFAALREIQSSKTLSSELIHELIERIEYGGGDLIRITFRFQDEFTLLSKNAEEVVA